MQGNKVVNAALLSQRIGGACLTRAQGWHLLPNVRGLALGRALERGDELAGDALGKGEARNSAGEEN